MAAGDDDDDDVIMTTMTRAVPRVRQIEATAPGPALWGVGGGALRRHGVRCHSFGLVLRGPTTHGRP